MELREGSRFTVSGKNKERCRGPALPFQVKLRACTKSMQVCPQTVGQVVVRTEPSTRRIRAVSIEDGSRVEPCRAPQPRQRSNRAASCLMSMSTATPFEAGPNTFKDNVKHLHRGQTTAAAQRLTSCCPLVQEGLSSRTTSNANAARGCPGAAPMARGTSTDGNSRRQQLIARCTLLRTLAVWCAAS